jgi:SAM-dependent methyltransferase
MAHPQQIGFIRALSKHLRGDYYGLKVIEIGSFNVNGTIRNCFSKSDYLGVDLAAGPGVDIVCDGRLVDHPDGAYQISLSCECFEHNPHWFETLLNMYRMTAPGGVVIFTCATKGRLEHGTLRTAPNESPGSQEIGWDYYLNLREEDFWRKIDFERLFQEFLFISNNKSKDLYFVGIKSDPKSLGLGFNFNAREFYKEYLAEQCSIEQAMARELGTLRRLLRLLFNLPIVFFSFLPDKTFQNIAVPYWKVVTVAKIRMRVVLNLIW